MDRRDDGVWDIRPASAGDADGIAVVHVTSWRATYPELVPQPVRDDLDVARRSEAWRQILVDGAEQTFVAEDADGRIRGFISIGASRDDDAVASVGELFALYLPAELWATGLGAQLHGVGLTALSERFADATLWVIGGNARARHFYERQGWSPDGATKVDDRGSFALAEVRYRNPLQR
ncbi:MAG: GNAT family N-acetyltransferase [Actinomycetes bacterium]